MRLVTIPGTHFQVDARIAPIVAEILRDFPVTLTAAYATSGHAAGGEHPKGLAIDFVPDPKRGGTWADVAAVAHLAEPQQGKPADGFRWVGYNGDAGHGDPAHAGGNAHAHAHLSFTGDAKAAAATLFGKGGDGASVLTRARRLLQAAGTPALLGAELAGGPAKDAADGVLDLGAKAGGAAAGAAANATVDALKAAAKSEIGANAARWALYAGLVIAALVVLYAGTKRTLSDQ